VPSHDGAVSEAPRRSEGRSGAADGIVHHRPANDTPEALATYSKTFAANPDKWYFLTGGMKDLNRLSYDVFRLSTIDGTLEHSSRFVLVDQQSRIRGFYDSSDAEAMQKLMTDLRGLLGRSA
jgi:protein SCO1/2